MVVIQNVARGVLVLFFPIGRDEWSRTVEPLSRADEPVDVGELELLGVVAPARLVVHVSGNEFGADAFRRIAPGAVVARVVVNGSHGPLVDSPSGLTCAVPSCPFLKVKVARHVLPDEERVVLANFPDESHRCGLNFKTFSMFKNRIQQAANRVNLPR